MIISSKLPQVGETIFTKMSAQAAQFGAINLSQGFPNFSIDPILEEILVKNARGNFHQYAPMQGNLQLREKISASIFHAYGIERSASSEILVTAGATQGIFTAIQALIQQGEEVVVLDPCYDCYDPAIRLAGGQPKHVPLNESYLPNWELIDQTIGPKTKLLITNNPHNPSGRVWSAEDWQQFELLLVKHPDLLILSDEVYEHIVFTGQRKSAIQCVDFSNRIITVSSFGKTFHITGWKTGYLVAPQHLMQEILKVHQFLVFSVNSVAQQTLADYLEPENIDTLADLYNNKRTYFEQAILSSRFELLPCEGTYFQLVDYSRISDESDVDFTQRLVKDFGIATIPVSVFSEEPTTKKHIRLCFAKTNETLEQAAEKLCNI